MSNIIKRLTNLFNRKKSFEDILLQKYGHITSNNNYGLSILFITDTHNCLSYDKESIDYLKNIKNYDCCILLGDHSANDLTEITNIIPKEKIYGVLGNHDSWDKYKEFSINDISGKIITIKNIKIAGISGSFKYKNSDSYVLFTHEESIELANNMEKADILVTHDKAFTEDHHDMAHDGLKGITEYIYKNHISTHIHGHLHEEYEENLKNGTKSIGLYQIKLLNI